MLGRSLLLVVICVSVDWATGTGCPLGFKRFKSSCYFFGHADATFAEAMSYCSHFSSSLTVITSSSENNFIRGYLLRKGQDRNYYIGGTDLRVENMWTWENPLRTIRYFNWRPGQPDNWKGNEHCLMFSRGSYRWNDMNCSEKHRFICEKKL